MTFGNPGRAAPDPGATGRTAPTARISLSALELNLRAVVGGSHAPLIDVRADAWGHGVDAVAPRAIAAGAGGLLIDEAGALALEGIVDSARCTLQATGSIADAVYGLTPGFEPVMSLQGRVLSTKRLREGEGVSYGYAHRASRDTFVALVTGGYAQGVVRALGDSASVTIAGRRHPIVGRVAMDVCVVDVGPDGPVTRGDDVVFFGDPSTGSPAIAEWSAATGLTGGELVTAVGLRNAREYAP
ncbi:alanine racemase C-terminal domain-containing protein [Microbacterium sp. cf046]|uniref:alanine racemase C-terminal domain-containing protein n=1 Tax=Microbacterium sp. cf046 TaxID=1761803 RepID=UPI0020C84CB8|nr:alanine racemase C-terminal domain-containing protein [Microbacterium sp. cf046]